MTQKQTDFRSNTLVDKPTIMEESSIFKESKQRFGNDEIAKFIY